MAKLLPLNTSIEQNAAFSRLRQQLAFIARCLVFYPGELAKTMQSKPCEIIAQRMAEHYFHRSRLLSIYQDMVLMFQALMTLAPVLQRQRNSMGFDWTKANVLTWFRENTAANRGRCYFGCFEASRVSDPVLLRDNLKHLKIMDTKFNETLEYLFRCYYGRDSVTGKLASTLFDPIMLCQLGDENSLRVGNKIFRLEKRGFPGCIDLRKEPATVLAYLIRRKEWQEKGRTRGCLEITISEERLSVFKQRARRIIRSGMSAKLRVLVLKRLIDSFVKSVRYARNGFEQVVELSHWLSNNLKPLYGAVDVVQKKKKQPDMDLEQVFRFPQFLVNAFLHAQDTSRYPRRPNFFYDPHKHDESTFLRFFSPYREED